MVLVYNVSNKAFMEWSILLYSSTELWTNRPRILGHKRSKVSSLLCVLIVEVRSEVQKV